MRRISAWVAIASIPTLIVGIYGMNLRNIPLTNSEFGFPVAVLIMVVSGACLYRLFKRANWL